MKTKLGFALVSILVVSISHGQQIRGIATDMAASATEFLAALSPDQRAQARLRFDNPNRFDWHYIPRSREGLPHKSMTGAQSDLAHALMGTALSDTGLGKAQGIMLLDQVLFERSGRAIRDSELYYLTVFGEPSSAGAWGWRVEGHHLSLNLTIQDGAVISTSPTFMGANPAIVHDGPRVGMQVLEAEQALARELLLSFDADRRAKVVYADRPPRDIETRESRRAEPGSPRGLPLSEMSSAQAALLSQLIEVYARRIRSELADAELERIRGAGTDAIHFGWAGSAAPGEPHYYRIHGPTFLIEYDNRQNGANHIHSVWRDLTGDFGADVLAQHYAQSPHHGGTSAMAYVDPSRLSVGLLSAGEAAARRAPLSQRN